MKLNQEGRKLANKMRRIKTDCQQDYRDKKNKIYDIFSTFFGFTKMFV